MGRLEAGVEEGEAPVVEGRSEEGGSLSTQASESDS